jgi:polysaccharide export outer membrane protein
MPTIQKEFEFLPSCPRPLPFVVPAPPRMKRIIQFVQLAAWSIFLLVPCVRSQTPNAPTTLATAGQSDVTATASPLVMPGDSLEIAVNRRPEFDWKGSIDGTGQLASLPYVDKPVPVVCRTEAAIAKDLAAAYSKYIVNPVVTVRVVDHNGRSPAVMLGAVRTAQRFLLQRPVRLNELIGLAGGVTDRASGEIQLYRTDPMICRPASAEGGEATYVVDDGTAAIRVIKIRDLIGGDPSANPVIRAGDIVTMLESQPVYVTGGVNAPQGVGFHDDLTLSRAVAMAGGLSPDARGGEIRIYRQDPKAGEPGSIDADLDAIRNHKKPDIALRPYDIVAVPQGGRGAAPRPSPNDVLDALTHNESPATLPLRVVN